MMPMSLFQAHTLSKANNDNIFERAIVDIGMELAIPIDRLLSKRATVSFGSDTQIEKYPPFSS